MTDVWVPRSYQDAMVEFGLATRRAGLFAEPGLGKTSVALAITEASLYDYCDTHRWMVVGPKLVTEDSWPRQLQKWTQFAGLSSRLLTSADLGLRAEWMEIDDTRRRRTGLTFGERSDKAQVKAAFRRHTEKITLCPYHLFPWVVKAWGANWPYDGLIGDESLALANSESNQHKAFWHVVYRLGAVTRLLLMTGTPDPNSLQQLHGQIRLLDGGARLGKTQTEFRERFMSAATRDQRTGQVWSWVPSPGAREDVQRRIADVCIAMRADDYLDLPTLIVNPIYVTLPADARKAYDDIERDLLLRIDPATTVLAPSQGVLAAKLRQLANGAIYHADGKTFTVYSDAKLDRLDSIMNETATPILLAYQFQSDWERIGKRFGKAASHVTAKGALDAFRAGRTRVLCMHASAAEGVDGLQDVSHTVVWFGATFNARHWIQFNARLRRDGSAASHVTVHNLIADDTVECRYAEKTLPDRVEEQDALLDALKFRVTSR